MENNHKENTLQTTEPVGVTETAKKWTVLRSTAGCKISGNMTKEEITKFTQTGEWSVAQIE